LVRTLEQSGQAQLGTRPASLRFSVYPKQIIDNTPPSKAVDYQYLASSLIIITLRQATLNLIPLNTINMTPPKPPVQNPVDIPFENGIILTTTINPITYRHSIQCDLCEVTIDLGISASGSAIHKHRDHEPCRGTAHKLRTKRARERIRV
jgi:hypothetical protein